MVARNRSITIEFRRSLALSLTIDLSLLSLAEEYEGFNQWIYSTYAALSHDLQSSIRTLFHPFANKLLFDELVRAHDLPKMEDLSAFIRWISELSDQTIRASNLTMLRKLAEAAGSAIPDSSIFENGEQMSRTLHALLASKLRKSEIGRLVRYLMDAEEMKSELVLLSTRFWDRHYRTEYTRCRPLEEQSLDLLRSGRISGTARDILVSITGKPVPEHVDGQIDAARRLVVIPTCHGGPYASVSPIEGTNGDLAIVYNCLPSKTHSEDARLPTRELFAPLKALADETRLDIISLLVGRELYAQQIVDRMDISQSAVSRHLRFMVACGVLQERKQEGMKFYAINGEKISEVIAHLDVLRHTVDD